jgi:hypothetical protein
MIRLVAATCLALSVASSAQSMTPQVSRPDSFVTPVVAGCGPGRTLVNGKCEARVEKRHQRREARRCVRRTNGVCTEYQ